MNFQKDKIIENETANLSLYNFFLDNSERLKLPNTRFIEFANKKRVAELRIQKRKQVLIIRQIEFAFSLVAIVLFIGKIIIYIMQRKGIGE